METIKKLFVLLIIGAVLIVAVNAVFTRPISEKNTTIVKGTFKGIQEGETKGEYSYTIWIQENDQSFRVPADWSECFSYNVFKEDIKPGQPIQIGIKDSWFRRPMVVSLIVNGSDYLTGNCINEEINDDKIKLPLISSGIIALVFFAYYKSSKKTKKRRVNTP